MFLRGIAKNMTQGYIFLRKRLIEMGQPDAARTEPRGRKKEQNGKEFTMKKYLALLLALSLALALVACGDKKEDDNGGFVPDDGMMQEVDPDGESEDPDDAEIEDEPEATFTEGDRGSGPMTIYSKLFSIDVPEGLDYELYTWYTSESDEKFGTYEINIAESGESSAVCVTVTTQRMINSLDDAAAECKRMNDFSGSLVTTPGDDIVINDVTYKTMQITGSESYSSTKLYYASFYETDNGDDVYVEIQSTEDGPFTNLPMSNELVQQLIDSLVLLK